MGSIKRFPNPGKLSKVEVGAIISLLVEHDCVALSVREDFKKHFDKEVSIEVIQQIRVQYDGLIKEKMAAYINLPNKLRIAKRSWRLKMLQKIALAALEQDARVITQKYDHNTYDHLERPDWKIAIQALMAADKIQLDAARVELDLERLRLMELQLQLRNNGGEDDEEGEEGDVTTGSWTKEA